MFWSKLKIAAGLLAAAGLAGTTTGLVTQHASAVTPTPASVTAADEEKADEPKIDKVPEALRGFRGRVVGRLIDRDAEQGTLVLEIRQLKNVWRNNEAENPKSCLGKTLAIDGVFGKFLDVLVVLKAGDGVQIEVKHAKGDGLTFLGEDLQKVELRPAPDKDKE